MTDTMVHESVVDALDARKIMGRILISLSRGPNCPCGIAREVGIPSDGVYLFLAEMLAIEWVVLLLYEEIATSLSEGWLEPALIPSSPLGMRELLQVARDQHHRLGSVEDRHLRLCERTHVWYKFFQRLNHLPLEERAETYIRITALGAESISIF